MAKSNIHAGHRERMKKQAMESGISDFSPHQMLELLLFYTIPQKDTNELAHHLINTFGSLSGVFDAPYEALLEIKGIKEHTASLIKLIPQILREYQIDKFDESRSMKNISDFGDFFTSLFIGITYEATFAVAVDYQMRIRGTKMIAKGDISTTSVPIKSLLDLALKNNSDLLIIAHNHPGGKPDPSVKDITSTQNIAKALKGVGIHLLDHFIVSGSQYVSMQSSGLECLNQL